MNRINLDNIDTGPPECYADINAMIALQVSNYTGALTETQRKKRGSIGYVLSLEGCRAARKLDLLYGAFHVRKDCAIAMVAGVSHSIASYIPYLRSFTQEYMTSETYPVYLSLCVEPQYRREWIGTSLMSRVLYEVERQQFKTALIDCDDDNKAAKEFLGEMGFEDISMEIVPGRSLFLKKIIPAEGLA
jgi:GNAT superfamily N-acetyltransferase